MAWPVVRRPGRLTNPRGRVWVTWHGECWSLNERETGELDGGARRSASCTAGGGTGR